MPTARRQGARALRFAMLAVAACAAAGPSTAAAGPLADSCRETSTQLHGACRGGEQAASTVSGTCRRAGAVQDTSCATPLGPRVSAAAIDAYEHSGLHRTLAFQEALGGDVPLRNAPWVGTHNSANSTSEPVTLSQTDSNQQLSLTDQLRLDVRSLELDAHWFPSLRTLGRAPVLCHARPASNAHAGCTTERLLSDGLAEIAAWLAGHPDAVLLLYIEDHLEGQEGHDRAAADLRAAFGSKLFSAPASSEDCRRLPLDVSRDDVRAAGAQVVVVSGGCGVGAAWRSATFSWADDHVESRPVGFQDFPACGPNYDRATYDATIVRYFEDSTALTAGTASLGAGTADDGLTPAITARMVRCGVDLFGFDQLLPDDGRLAALAWTWAEGEPAAGDCATQRAGDGRWAARDCAASLPVACRSAADGAWSVGAPAAGGDAAAVCAAAGTQHAAPRTGYEAQLLRVAMNAAGAEAAWIGLRRQDGSWAALDARS